MACKALAAQGVATLATTLFCMPQAALAAESGCVYIAPYINGLRVHFEAGYVDDHKGFTLASAAGRYFRRVGWETVVLPASLTRVHEVLACGGAEHVTVSPALLGEMAATTANGDGDGVDWGKGFVDEDEVERLAGMDWGSVVRDEAAYRLAVTMDADGASEKKLVDAVVIFCRMQRGLEELVEGYL